MMTVPERAAAYAAAFPLRPPLQLVTERGRDVAYGRWVIGARYASSTPYYGSYPPGFLERVQSLFPDVEARETLHVFSGALPAGPYTRVDVNPACRPEIVCDVVDLPAQTEARWRLVIADPPYSRSDARHYGTPMIDRGRVLRALAAVTVPGGHLAWLDQVWPMHRVVEWRTAMRIAVTRSTNHRIRDLTIFERVGDVA